MGDADAVGDRTRIAYVLPRAAASRAAHRRAMIVKLERHADGFRPGARRERGDDAGIHAAGHGDDDAPRIGRSLQIELGRLNRGLHGRAYSRPDPRPPDGFNALSHPPAISGSKFTGP